jgi:hypothetical protein
MRNVIATMAVLMLGAVPLRGAQDVTQPRAEQARQRLDQIKDRLQLTPEQVERVQPVLADEMQKVKALRDKDDAAGQSRRGRLKLARELRDIQDKSDDQLKTILSQPQMEEMKKIREERRQQLRDHARQM